MAISFSRPDPSQPSSVSSAAFTVARRGFDQAEVRDFLRMVAAELARLQERERFLEHELRVAQQRSPAAPATLDDDVVMRMLGEEAARILQTARDGATQLRTRAEEYAERLLREAGDEVQRVREEADIEAHRRRVDAAADAEAEVEMAKQQGRDMVNEARAYRERVLNDLARRRELAREQIEQLVHGRDRLVQAFERARLAAVDVMSELSPIGEPDEYVSLSPTTGPVPLMVPNRLPSRPNVADLIEVVTPVARESGPEPTPVDGSDMVAPAGPDLGDESEAPPVDTSAEPGSPMRIYDVEAEEPDAEDLAREGDVPDAAPAHDIDPSDDLVAALADVVAADHREELDAAADDEGGDVVSHTITRSVTTEVDGDGHEATVETVTETIETVTETVTETVEEIEESDDVDSAEFDDEIDDDRPIAPVVSLFAIDAERAGTVADTPLPAAAPTPGASVDDLFARLRASRPDAVARSAAAEADSSPPPAAIEPVPPSKPSVFERTEVVGDMAGAPDTVSTEGDSVFVRRDAVLTPLIVAAARRLKRVLADEQNDVLHVLRRKEPTRDLDVLLPKAGDHIARYVDAIETELTEAAVSGAASLDDGDRRSHERAVADARALQSAHEMLADSLIDPLRERLDRAVADAEGSNAELSDMVRTIYREWKTRRIDEHLDDIVRSAFGHGALAAVRPGTRVSWMVDPSGPACPDADDNALAGPVPAGEAFPTEHTCAPAHPGCRCMLVRAHR